MFSNDQIQSMMGDKVYSLAEFNDLLGQRMSPTAKANYLKGLSMAEIVTVRLWLDRDTKEFMSEIVSTAAQPSPVVEEPTNG